MSEGELYLLFSPEDDFRVPRESIGKYLLDCLKKRSFDDIVTDPIHFTLILSYYVIQNMRMEPEGSSVSPNYSGLNVDLEVQKWFIAVDTDHSGKICSKELKTALINGQGKPFSDKACHLMIALFDKNNSGTIDISEFQHLYTYINQWTDIFRAYDKDNSGYIEEAELQPALHNMGYRLSNNFITVLLQHVTTDSVKRMSLDQFIVACVKIQRLTNAFRLRDKEMKGVISFEFEDFLGVVLEDFL